MAQLVSSGSECNCVKETLQLDSSVVFLVQTLKQEHKEKKQVCLMILQNANE